MRVPKTGSAEPESPDELSSFAMRSDGTREASGINAGMTRVPEAQEGRIAGPGNYDVSQQNADKDRPTPGVYNHPHIGGRPPS
jgi:hypothetical protein